MISLSACIVLGLLGKQIGAFSSMEWKAWHGSSSNMRQDTTSFFILVIAMTSRRNMLLSMLGTGASRHWTAWRYGSLVGYLRCVAGVGEGSKHARSDRRGEKLYIDRDRPWQ